MLNIKKEDGFFRKGFGIKHIVIWDDILNKRLGQDGPALFCKAPPGYLVHVELDSNNNIESKDIHIHYSIHNSTDIVDRIIQRQPEIAKICKTSIKLVFILDVLNMKIIERSDFTFYKPINGLNSLFILQEKDEDVFYMLMNPTGYSNEDVFSVFITHLYTSSVCLPPIMGRSDSIFCKQFLQILSSMMYKDSKDIDIKPGDEGLLKNVNFQSLPQRSIKPFGKTDRLHLLTLASVEQSKRDLEKKIKKSGG